MAFKPDTDDMRDSPAIGVVEQLLREGAVVHACDPKALQNARSLWQNKTDIAFLDSVDEALQDADAAIIVTAWPQFAQLTGKRLKGLMRNPVVIDGRRLLSGEALGPDIQYLGIGIGSEARVHARTG